jgi:hypothetical protein
LAQEKTEGPGDEKAQKTYKGALEYLHERKTALALDDFKKADKQDGGHCLACQKQMIKYGLELGEWKTAELAAQEMVAEFQGERDTAIAHYQFAMVLMDEGLAKHKDDFFVRVHEEITKALAAHANFPEALLVDGRALAQLRQDDEAKAKFEEFVKMKPAEDPNRQRALRYITRPELARARMAPPFVVTTMGSESPWMTCKAGLCCSIFGLPGAHPAARRCRISGRSPRSFRGSRW